MNRQPHGKYRALPGSLIAVTSPPIMRASLRDNARPNPLQRIGLGEVLEQFRLPVSHCRRHCSANYPVRRITTVMIHSALAAPNRSWFSAGT
jgi:hypothetical protein